MISLKDIKAKALSAIKQKFSKDKYSVGLDIGTHTMKAVKLKFTKEATELCGFELMRIEPSLKECLLKIKELMKSESVNIGFSGSSTVIRYVNFPRMEEPEFRQALKFEAAKYIPFPLNEINLDGSILKEDLPENKMLVLIAAVKKELVSSRLKHLEETGLKTKIADIDSLALINTFKLNFGDKEDLKQKAIALLNIGASISGLDILEAGIPRFSRDIPIAGNTFTQKVADTFSLDLKAAEDLKIKPDNEKLPKIMSGTESVVGSLAGEIRTSFDYYESQSASTVAKIFLSGGGCCFPGLAEKLSDLLGIEVGCWDPLTKLNVAQDLDLQKAKSISSQLAVAVGLALRQ